MWRRTTWAAAWGAKCCDLVGHALLHLGQPLGAGVGAPRHDGQDRGTKGCGRVDGGACVVQRCWRIAADKTGRAALARNLPAAGGDADLDGARPVLAPPEHEVADAPRGTGVNHPLDPASLRLACCGQGWPY